MEQSKRKLLVVDDIQVNRILLKELFLEEFDVVEAADGMEAMELITQYKNEIAVVLLDIVMPRMDGFQVLEAMNASGYMQSIPVIMITGETDDDKVLRGYKMGVSDLVAKPFNPDIVYRRVSNMIDLYAHKNNLEDMLEEQKEKLQKQDKRLKQANNFLIDALGTAVEFRNLESGEHVKRMSWLTKIFLRMVNDEYPLTKDEIETIANASVLHDIGKIAIPDSVLLKPGKLTDEEFSVMKTHPLRGCEILESLEYVPDQEYFQYCYEICRHHHERWDGRGYPDGQKGDEISIWAQAAALADVYDALTNDRAYKKAFTHDTAIHMILDGECGVFNPKLMERLRQNKDNIPVWIQEMREEEMGRR